MALQHLNNCYLIIANKGKHENSRQIKRLTTKVPHYIHQLE